MKHLLDQLRDFARLRLQEDLLDATARFYQALRTKIDDKLRHFSFCRSRLVHLLQTLDSPLLNMPANSDSPVAISEEALQHTLHPTNTLHIVLPSGDNHIERSARNVVKLINASELQRLEHVLQKLVLEPRGGLTALCAVNADMLRTLVAPMIEQTTAFLGELLPVTDVAEVELSAARTKKIEMGPRIQDYHSRAVPPCNPSGTDEQTFVLVPESDAGQVYTGMVKQAVPSSLVVKVQGAATDLMFCREHGCLKTETVNAMLELCLPAYYGALASPQSHPHSRFDVTEWMPLNE